MTALKLRTQRACAWAGVVFLALFCTGWVIAGFVPPPDPSDSPEQLAQMFRADTTRIRLGMCICIFASALLLPWGGAVVARAALAFFTAITAVVITAINRQAAEPDDGQDVDLATRVTWLEQRLAELDESSGTQASGIQAR